MPWAMAAASSAACWERYVEVEFEVWEGPGWVSSGVGSSLGVGVEVGGVVVGWIGFDHVVT